MSRVILLTPGDPGGIGPEILLKSLRQLPSSIRRSLVVVGAYRPFLKARSPYPFARIEGAAAHSFLRDISAFRKQDKNKIPFVEAPPALPTFKSSQAIAGFEAGWSVEFAARTILSGHAEALVTGPISKENLQLGGYPFSGHTDLLGSLCGVRQPTMMLANQFLRVALVTVHNSLGSVSSKLTQDGIQKTLSDTIKSLGIDWGIQNPRVAVTALNPHAGESGLFGREEIEVIYPAIKSSRKKFPFATIDGPFPADTLFAKNSLAKKKDRYDAVVCMYHDQGLIPVKLLDFPKTVNVSLGLPLIRTSVDHGTAFDIAGKNKADPSSMIEATRLAWQMLKFRSKIKPEKGKQKDRNHGPKTQ